MSNSAEDRLRDAVEKLVSVLHTHDQRIVFAESCTAGLIAATLGRAPGISNHFCGSAVVYRNATKSAWLGISERDLNDPDITPVSPQIATAMAVGVLRKTPEADVAASVTGHLGPDSPPGFDGVAFAGVAVRSDDGTARLTDVQRLSLNDKADRVPRQHEIAARVVEFVTAVITNHRNS